MITATARKHVVRALRDALRIRESRAREIVSTIFNENALRLLGDTDMRTVKALVCNGGDLSPTVHLYVNNGQGYEFTGVVLSLVYEDLDRWNVLPIEEAYAIAGEIHENRGPQLTSADERMAAEINEETEAREAANDDMSIDLDDVFGPVPENRNYQWVGGTVSSADLAPMGDHVLAVVDLADGTRQTMAMFPLFSGPEDLLAYARQQVGVSARLSVGRVNMFDENVPAGFDRSMPVLDMIVHARDVPGLIHLNKRAV